jgi:hypothetical protein
MLIGVMFTSLKVVNRFVLQLLNALLLYDALIILYALLTASSCRVPIDGTAFTASSLVILPSLPVPVTAAGAIFFSSNIFFAAGDGVPEA